MSYEKLGFVSNQILKAEHLNHMEDGIAKACSGGGAGGTISWNDLTDKPFYEETTTTVGDTLTWDGNTDGLACALDLLYKVSNKTFTLDELNGSVINMSDGQSFTCTTEDSSLFELADGVYVLGDPVAYVSEQAAGIDLGDGIMFPEAGLYFLAEDASDGLFYVSSLTIPGYTDFVNTTTIVKTIDTKYLPKHLQFGEAPPAFDIQWDGDMTGHETFEIEENVYFVKVSDEVFTKQQLLGATFYCNDGYKEALEEEAILENSELGIIEIYQDILVVTSATDFINGAELPEGSFSNGVWFINITGEDGYYTNRLTAKSDIVTIDEKYLPESIQGGSGVTSYNDLTDKPFSEQINKIVVATEYVTASSVPSDGKWVIGPRFAFTPVNGQIYTLRVTSDDEFVECDVIGNIGSNMNMPIYSLGSSSDLVYGTSFANNNTWFIYFTSTSASLNWYVEIIKKDSIITYLDEKYIPDTIARKTDVLTNYYDLENIPCGEKILSEYLQPTSYDFTSVSQSINITKTVKPTSAVIYFDGEEYHVGSNAAAIPMPGVSGVLCAVYGNPLLFNPSQAMIYNSDVPVAIVYNPMFGGWTAYVKSDNLGTHTIGFYDKVLIKIDEKYLPTTVPTVHSAYVGQTIAVKSVDGNGNPIEWEAIDNSYNNLKDKPIGETKTVLMKDKEITFTQAEENIGLISLSTSELNTICFDGQLYEVSLISTYDKDSAAFTAKIWGNPYLYDSTRYEDNGIPVAFVWRQFAGAFYCYVRDNDLGTHTLGLYNRNIITLDEKYLPDAVGSIVVRSSTENSTKKFKITVDDSGTISATEVI